MDAMSWIAIIGTVASVGGAVVSLLQAGRSQTAAAEAKQVRAELIDHRKVSELSQLQTVCKKSQRSMEKYGPGSVPSSLTGVSPNTDAKEVQEFMLLIKENRNLFGTRVPNEADEFCKILTPSLDQFAQATEPDEMRSYGTQVLLQINNMTSIIKKKVDSRRESVHRNG